MTSTPPLHMEPHPLVPEGSATSIQSPGSVALAHKHNSPREDFGAMGMERANTMFGDLGNSPLDFRFAASSEIAGTVVAECGRKYTRKIRGGSGAR